MIVAHSSALRAGWIWDDDYYVTRNVALRSLEGLGRIWFEIGAVPQYYPLTHTTFWIEYHLWGLNPIGYHAVNVLLHAGITLLLWVILKRLRIPAAWFAALLFGVHPLHVESVVWVTERKNVLSGFLYLLSLSSYLHFKCNFKPADEAPRRTRWYWSSLALFVLALLSKSVTSSLPAVILLITYWKLGRVRWRDVRPLVPFFAFGIAMGTLTGWMERHVVGAAGPEWSFTLLDRCLIAGRAVLFYLGKVIVPYPLIFIYPRWTIDPHAVLQFVPPIVVIAGIATLFALRRRIGRGPLVAALFFVGTLFPALGFINLMPMRYSFVADHFAYLASIGPIVLLTVAMHRCAKRIHSQTAVRSLGVVIVATLMLVTWVRGRAYENLETLWRDTIARNPTAWMADANLANIELDRGQLPEAETLLNRALAINPRNAEAMLSLGRVQELKGDDNAAADWYRRAIEARPNYPDPYYNLAVLAAKGGDRAQAVELYGQVLTMNPDHVAAHVNLGVLLFESGQVRGAIEEYSKALRVNPDSASAHRNFANALSSLGKNAEADEHLRAAKALEPDSAIDANNLGIQFAQQGKFAEAKTQFERTVALKPDLFEAQLNLGLVCEQLDQKNEAVDAYKKAAALRPDDPRVRNALKRSGVSE